MNELNLTTTIPIYTLKNAKALKKIPILDDGQIYLYVIHSLPQGNIKIGKTKAGKNLYIQIDKWYSEIIIRYSKKYNIKIKKSNNR